MYFGGLLYSGLIRGFIPNWSVGRKAYGRNLQNEEWHSGLGDIHPGPGREAKDETAELPPRVQFPPYICLFIRKLRAGEFNTSHYKDCWGGQCNSKFKSVRWNLIESQFLVAPCLMCPETEEHHLCVFSGATCRSQSWFQAKPAQAPQFVCNIRGLMKPLPAQLMAIFCPSATFCNSILPGTRLPHRCPSPRTQTPSASDARATPSLEGGHSVWGAAASRNISAKCILIDKYKEVAGCVTSINISK